MRDLNVYIWPKPRIHFRWSRHGILWVHPENHDVRIYMKGIITFTRWWGVALVFHPRAKPEEARQ